jgi:ribosomal protein S18 acetylase RimI-like enzyme
MIRPTTPADTPTLVALTDATGFFKPLEVVALQEVFDDYFATNQADGHVSVTFETADGLLGFAYYAPTPMTDRTWHLYWIAVAKTQQSRGVGGEILKFVENDIRERGGRLLVIETSSTSHYEPTRRFYLKHGYKEATTIEDFYADHDGMTVFTRRLDKATGRPGDKET